MCKFRIFIDEYSCIRSFCQKIPLSNFLLKEVLMRLTLLRTGYDDAEFLMAGASVLQKGVAARVVPSLRVICVLSGFVAGVKGISFEWEKIPNEDG